MARWRRKRTGQSRETQGWEWSCTPMHEMHTWKTSKRELSTRPLFCVWPARFGCIFERKWWNITDTQRWSHKDRLTETDLDKTAVQEGHKPAKHTAAITVSMFRYTQSVFLHWSCLLTHTHMHAQNLTKGMPAKTHVTMGAEHFRYFWGLFSGWLPNPSPFNAKSIIPWPACPAQLPRLWNERPKSLPPAVGP